jgi:hypothetical protein
LLVKVLYGALKAPTACTYAAEAPTGTEESVKVIDLISPGNTVDGHVAPKIDADQAMLRPGGQHPKNPCPTGDGSGMLIVFAPF